MDRLTLRLSPDLLARFDTAAADRGGRSALLRRLIADASAGSGRDAEVPFRRGGSAKLTLRLTSRDLISLEREAARAGLRRTQWCVALVRRRLHGSPQLTPPEASALIDGQRELRRIGVNINQIARALNTAVMQGVVLDLETAQLAAFAVEIRGHVLALGDAFQGNLDYWAAEP